MIYRTPMVSAIWLVLACANPVGLFPASSLAEVRVFDARNSSTFSGEDATWLYETVEGCSPWLTPLFLGLDPDFTLEFVSDKPRTPPIVVYLVGSSLHLPSQGRHRYCVLDPERAHRLRVLIAAT
jgi:hypothetical protein